MAETLKQRYMRELGALKNERSTWWPHWRDLSENLRPRGSRFLETEVNKGIRKNSRIINSTPLVAVRTLQSGIMSGMTPPARPWFRLTTPDPSLAEYGAVRAWLEVVEERIRDTLRKSNAYNSLHTVYGDLAVFGTALMHVDEDPDDGIRCYVWRVGQYLLANSARLDVNTVMTETRMTVAQMVERFGIDKVSPLVKNQYERKEFHSWIDVVHVVEPNRDYSEGRLGPNGKPWKSCWFEAAETARNGLLSESGYYEQPSLAVRWEVTSEDVYGSSPGMDALGDCRALQQFERDKAKALQKIIDPPMRAPFSILNQRASLLPGDVTYVPDNAPNGVFAPAVVVPPATVEVASAAIQERMQHIKEAFYADLWLSMTEGENAQMTAREVVERHEEKMLQLGPVMERLESELLGPLIERAFGVLLRTPNALPPPPRELQGQPLRIDYVSIMAQAQKMVGTTAIQQLAGFALQFAEAKPEVLDKVNLDNMVDEYADSLGVKSNLIVPDDQVAQIRAQRAQQQQAMQQQAMAMAGARGAKDLSQADTSGDNALTRILGTVAPVAAGEAGNGQ